LLMSRRFMFWIIFIQPLTISKLHHQAPIPFVLITQFVTCVVSRKLQHSKAEDTLHILVNFNSVRGIVDKHTILINIFSYVINNVTETMGFRKPCSSFLIYNQVLSTVTLTTLSITFSVLFFYFTCENNQIYIYIYIYIVYFKNNARIKKYIFLFL